MIAKNAKLSFYGLIKKRKQSFSPQSNLKLICNLAYGAFTFHGIRQHRGRILLLTSSLKSSAKNHFPEIAAETGKASQLRVVKLLTLAYQILIQMNETYTYLMALLFNARAVLCSWNFEANSINLTIIIRNYFK